MCRLLWLGVRPADGHRDLVSSGELEGERAPRLYWTLGKRFFNPVVFQRQNPNQACSLRGPNYQLMRNFLFAAAYAERHRKTFFGVIAIGPRNRSDPLLRSQVVKFSEGMLLPDIATGRVRRIRTLHRIAGGSWRQRWQEFGVVFGRAPPIGVLRLANATMAYVPGRLKSRCRCPIFIPFSDGRKRDGV